MALFSFLGATITGNILFVLRFYSPVNQWGHVERGQFS